jgi:hypothetical protein
MNIYDYAQFLGKQIIFRPHPTRRERRRIRGRFRGTGVEVAWMPRRETMEKYRGEIGRVWAMFIDPMKDEDGAKRWRDWWDEIRSPRGRDWREEVAEAVEAKRQHDEVFKSLGIPDPLLESR